MMVVTVAIEEKEECYYGLAKIDNNQSHNSVEKLSEPGPR